MTSDLINRQDAINKLMECGDFYTRVGNNEAKRGVSQCIGIIHDIPPVKHGMWIKMSDPDGFYWACSECGENIPRIAYFDQQFDIFLRLKSLERTDYCSYCGAKMKNGPTTVNYVLRKGVVELLRTPPETKGGWVD